MTRYVVLTASILIATAAAGCEVGDPSLVVDEPITNIPTDSNPGRCGGQTPATCVVACGQETTGQGPFCVDGKWRCDDGVPDTSCPDFQGLCDAPDGCGWGYTCVQSLSHPIPADAGICRKGIVDRDTTLEACSTDGLLAPTEFLDTRESLTGSIVKLAGTLDVRVKCSKNACGPSNPCCNACVGDYVIDVRDPDDPTREIGVTIAMDLVACGGNTCDVSCGPLDVGDTYVIWGLLDRCDGSSGCTLLHMGSCPF